MIHCRSTDNVLILTLDRPEQRNAMSPGLVASLVDHLSAARADEDVGAVLVTGSGRGFCSGSDLAELAAMNDAARDDFEALSGRAARMLIRYDLPVVMAVHGFAIGGGLTLAAAGDVVITTPSAKWSLPEVPIGLFPAWGLEVLTGVLGA